MIRVPERLAPLRSAASMIVANRLAPSRLAFRRSARRSTLPSRLALARSAPVSDGVGEVAGEQVGAGQLGVGQAGAGQVGPAEVQPVQVEPAQVDAGQIGRRVARAGREPRLELRARRAGRRACRPASRSARRVGDGRRGRQRGRRAGGARTMRHRLVKLGVLRAGWPMPRRTRDRADAVPLVPMPSDRRAGRQPWRFTAGRPGAILASLRAFT